ncbi:MAG: bifunctional demethylmenaquinone methyltransferase/2-methoxy-6-polyprenyl-1,4-benzoquinol methylase UbiE [Proteobacteria bacterium]|nr:bifunctional demethylmenaquinone methyltransferase/2-methoxy-6-polyprenyl-1,4-benzoquinol methylase UbiE [Pseudomonadota bacterium]
MTDQEGYIIDNQTPEGRKQFIKNLFDDIVPTYDLLNHVLSAGIDTIWRRNMFRHMASVIHQPVIDLCCGTGDLSKICFQKGARLTSLDFSMNMLLKGRKRKALQGKLIQADASRIPVHENSFHTATIAFGIRNIPDLDHFIKEVYRVLKPGGQFAILELVRPRDPFINLLYRAYLEKLLPLIGGIVSGQPSAYQYLSKTISTFVDPYDLQVMLEKYGFVKARHFPQTFGVATIIVCNKKEA